MSAQGGPQDETGPGIKQESLNQVIDQGLKLWGSNQPKLTLRASQLGMQSSHLIFIFNDFLHFFSLHKLKKYCVFPKTQLGPQYCRNSAFVKITINDIAEVDYFRHLDPDVWCTIKYGWNGYEKSSTGRVSSI